MRKRTMTPTKHNILAKMKTTHSKILFHNNSEPIIQNKVLLVVLLEKGTSRTIVKRVWVWEWEIDKVVDTTSKMKVEVQMLQPKTVGNLQRFNKYLTNPISSNSKDSNLRTIKLTIQMQIIRGIALSLNKRKFLKLMRIKISLLGKKVGEVRGEMKSTMFYTIN